MRIFTPALILATLGILISPAHAVPPVNDNKANATVLTGDSATGSADNTQATQESGDFASRTVWWEWTASGNGRATFDTINTVAVNPTMYVYLVEPSGRISGYVTSSTSSSSVPVAMGTRYLIGIGQNNTSNSPGLVRLSVSLNRSDTVGSLNVIGTATMDNDNFANRIALAGDSATGIFYPVSASRETGEPSVAGDFTSWWTYRPSANGRLTITTLGSDSGRNYTLAAYMGSSFASLKRITSQNSTSTISISFPVTADTDYVISTGNENNFYIGSTVVTCTLQHDASIDVSGLNIPNKATMGNDAFSNAITLTGDQASAIAYPLSATREAGEPALSGENTYWWKVRPSANGRLSISTLGSDSGRSKKVAVYMGATLASLIPLDYRDSTDVIDFSIPVTADTDYVISTGISNIYYIGNLVLTCTLQKGTSIDISSLNIPNQASFANDSFTNAITLTGDNVSAIAYPWYATREAGEPTLAAENTFWWKVRPSANGRLAITTQGSEAGRSKRVVVYMGNSLSSLKPIAYRDSTDVINFSIPVTANTDYVISTGISNIYYIGNLVLTCALQKGAGVDISSLNIPNQATFANDSFASAIPLVGTQPSAIAYSYSATRESGEPAVSANNTFWWTARPDINGRLILSTEGSDSNTSKTICVYLGTSFANLKVVATSTSTDAITLSIPVTANTTYVISTGVANTSYIGNLVLTASVLTSAETMLNIVNAATMANDSFAGSINLNGNNVSAIGYTEGASKEALELPATGERTLWWNWTAPVTGSVVIDYAGSSLNSIQSTVWQGISLPGLTPVTRSGWTGLQFSFNATAGQTYHIVSAAPFTSTAGSAVVMTISGPPSKPIYATQLQSRWLNLGDALSITSPTAGSNVTYRWQKNGVFITGATGLIYSLPSVALANAGVYKSEARNALGTTLSGAANIGVMDTASRNVTVNEGATMKLTLPVAGPTGALSFRWMRNGLDMADGKVGTQTISGTGTATLSITGYGSANEGTYTCRVTMVNAADASTPLVRTSGDFVVGSFLRPVVANTQVPDCEVARQFTWQLTASNSPTSFAATGLPSGLTLNTSTGLITGTPTASSTGVTVKVTASNAAGAGPAQNFVLPISSLRAGLAATYAGVIDRDPVLNAQLGGTITTTVATSGSVTGTLRLGTFSHPLTGRVIVPAVDNATANLTIPRTGKPALMLSLVFAADGSVNGSLEDGTVSIAVTAGVNPWKTTNQPLSMAGLYNVLLDLPAAWIGDQSVPQGLGYMQMTVTGKTGAVSISGRTGDGIAFTNSVTVWADGRMPLFALLYSNKGSIRGLPQITVAGAAPAYADNSVGGTLDWQKTGASSTSDHTYSAGFGPIDLIPDGSKWVKPTTGTMLFGLPNQANNLRVEFTDGGIESVAQAGQISQTFQLLPSAVAVFNSATSGNPTGVTMKLTTSTGLFSGSFKLTDPKPAATGTQTRTVNYSGLLVSHLQEGYGWFALPGLTTGSDVLCGQVLLKAP